MSDDLILIVGMMWIYRR